MQNWNNLRQKINRILFAQIQAVYNSKKNSTMNTEARKAQQKIQEFEITERLRHIKNKIMVMSGKGGVGKSSVAAYLSIALAKRGRRIGLMDVDLHGPSIPRILGLKNGVRSAQRAEKMLPVKYLPNMEVMSIEMLTGDKILS